MQVIQFDKDTIDQSDQLSFKLTRRFPGGDRTRALKLQVRRPPPCQSHVIQLMSQSHGCCCLSCILSLGECSLGLAHLHKPWLLTHPVVTGGALVEQGTHITPNTPEAVMRDDMGAGGAAASSYVSQPGATVSTAWGRNRSMSE